MVKGLGFISGNYLSFYLFYYLSTSLFQLTWFLLLYLLFFNRDASGQGRFSTILRSYSRGAQGVLLVYDITNKWSFSGLDRWLQEVEEVNHFVLILFCSFLSKL